MYLKTEPVILIKRFFIFFSIISFALIGVPSTILSNSSLTSFSKNSIGDNVNGFTSAQFVQHVFLEAKNILLPSTASQQFELGNTIHRDDLQPGDVVFFQGSSLMSGIYIDSGSFIIVTTSGIAERNLSIPFWDVRFVGAKRFEGVISSLDDFPAAKFAFDSVGDNINRFTSAEFVQHVFLEAKNILLPRTANQQFELGNTIHRDDLQPGDVVFFQGSSLMSGIYIDNGSFIIVTTSGIAERSFSIPFWDIRYVGGKRFEGAITSLDDFPTAKFAFDSKGDNINRFTSAEFVQHVFLEAKNILLPRTASQQFELGNTLHRNDLQPGDVVFFQGSSLMSGIYIDNGSFIIVTTSGITERNFSIPFWDERFVGAKRFEEATSSSLDEFPAAKLAFDSIGDNINHLTSAEFVQHVFKESMQISLPTTAREQWLLGTPVDYENIEIGDVVFFQGTSIMSGIYIGNSSFIIVTSSGIAERNFSTPFWNERYLGTRRYNKESLERVHDLSSPLITKAFSLLGTPFSPNGLNPNEGFYSGSFIHYVFKEAKGSLLSKFSSRQYEAGIKIDNKDRLHQGDLVFFQGDGGLISGIYIGHGQFITVTNNGVSIRDLIVDAFWSSRYVGAVRYTDEILALTNPKTYKTHENPVIREAMKYIGTPYLLTGSTLDAFDCSFFTQTVYREALNIHLPRITYRQWEVGETILPAGTQINDIDLDAKIRPGDAIYFSNTWQKGISHVGIYLGNYFFIHASGDEGETTISYLGDHWKGHFTGVKRFDNLSLRLDKPIVFESSKLLGTPYLLGGTSPNEGFDTSGFVQYVFNITYGIQLPRFGSQMWLLGTDVSRDHLEYGDVVFFQGSSLIPSIYIGNNQVILVTQAFGVRLIHIDESDFWSTRYVGARRYPIPEVENKVAEVSSSYVGNAFKGTTAEFVKTIFYEALEINLPQSAVEQWHSGSTINFEEIKPGDVIFFSTSADKKHPELLAIYIGNASYITVESNEVVKKRINDNINFLDHLYGVKRFN